MGKIHFLGNEINGVGQKPMLNVGTFETRLGEPGCSQNGGTL